MSIKEIRELAPEDIKARLSQWRRELFQARFKTQSSEARDTSMLRKLRRTIARGETVLTQKAHGIVVQEKPEPVPQDKPAKAAKPRAKKAKEAKE